MVTDDQSTQQTPVKVHTLDHATYGGPAHLFVLRDTDPRGSEHPAIALNLINPYSDDPNASSTVIALTGRSAVHLARLLQGAIDDWAVNAK